MNNYSFDTHALVWYFLKSKTLSSKAKNIISGVFRGFDGGFVSIMVILELYYVSLKDPNFNFSDMINLIENSNIVIIPFGREVLEKSLKLPKELHIHDRVIIATAIVSGSQLITKDEIIRKFFPKETIW